MKKVLAAAVMVAFAVSGAFAADEIALKAKNGDVKFNHKKHQDSLKDCKVCHGDAAPGKIAALGKDWAHKTCKGCHETKKAGPTKCGECHKK